MIEKEIVEWNPWTGCKYCSTGCRYCKASQNVSIRALNSESNKLLKKSYSDRKLPVCERRYKIDSGSIVQVCTLSDFFVEGAEVLRQEAIEVIKQRKDVLFIINTKRPEKIDESFGESESKELRNIAINVVAENTETVWSRLSDFINMQSNIVHRGIVLNPLLESVDITPFLSTGLIEQVEVYGEHCTDLGDTHRKLDIDWVKSISSQCRIYDTRFKFKSTGTILRNGNSEATIRACKDQIELAKFYNLNYEPVNQSDNYWEAIAEKLDDIRLSELAYEINSRKDGTFLKNSI